MPANPVEVFGERDGERRRAAIARIHQPDVVFHDPGGPVTGHEALHGKVQGILDGAPPVVRGVDIALVRDGRIAQLYTLLLTE